MPDQQINRGQDFALGDQVTAQKLQDIADKGYLLKGSISGQTDLTVAKTGSYSYTSGVTLAVSSTAHGLSTGEAIRATFSETSGGAGSQFTGAKTVTVGSPDTFTITVAGTETSSSGTVSFYTLVAEDDSLLILDASDTSATKPKKVGVHEILKSEQDVEFKNINASGDLVVIGNALVEEDFDVLGKVTLDSTGAFRLPVGTTAERPASPVVGDVRFNSTTLKSEVWNGTKWKVGSGSPFEASGGDYIIGPDENFVSATFTATPANSIITVQKVDHEVRVGQYVEFTSTKSGFESVYGLVTDAHNDDFVIGRIGDTTGSAFSTPYACTYRKSGDSKIHVFEGNDTFIVGDEDIWAEILVVAGGGGAQASNNSTRFAAGGGGGVIHGFYKFLANTEYPVVVGAGGFGNAIGSGNATAANGGNSSIGTKIAYGGKGGKYVSTNTGNNRWVGGASGGSTETGHQPYLEVHESSYTFGSTSGWLQSGSGARESARYLSDNVSIAGIGIVSSIENKSLAYGFGGYASGWTSSLTPQVTPVIISYGSGGSTKYQGGASDGSDGQPGRVVIKYQYSVDI